MPSRGKMSITPEPGRRCGSGFGLAVDRLPTPEHNRDPAKRTLRRWQAHFSRRLFSIPLTMVRRTDSRQERFCFRRASCCRRARFSKNRSRREREMRVANIDGSLSRRSMGQFSIRKGQIGRLVYILDLTADLYFGETQVPRAKSYGVTSLPVDHVNVGLVPGRCLPRNWSA